MRFSPAGIMKPQPFQEQSVRGVVNHSGRLRAPGMTLSLLCLVIKVEGTVTIQNSPLPWIAKELRLARTMGSPYCAEINAGCSSRGPGPTYYFCLGKPEPESLELQEAACPGASGICLCAGRGMNRFFHMGWGLKDPGMVRSTCGLSLLLFWVPKKHLTTSLS